MNNLPYLARPTENWQELPVTGQRELTWHDQESWCEAQCQGAWARSHGAFWFELDQDRVYFVLRWC